MLSKPLSGDSIASLLSGLYRAIGLVTSVKKAEDLEPGKAALLQEGMPENKTPGLLTGRGVDVAGLVLIPQPTVAMTGVEEPRAKQSEQQVGIPSRLALVRDLRGLDPADWATLVAAVEGAGIHIGHNLPIPVQAAQLVHWAESTNGPGLAAIEEAYDLFFGQTRHHNRGRRGDSHVQF